MPRSPARRAVHPRRAWVPLILALITAGFLIALSDVGRAQEALSMVVRETTVHPDGTTEIVVNVSGSARPDVLPADAFVVTEQGEEVEGLEVEPLLEEVARGDVVVGLVFDVSGSMEGEPMAQTIAAAVDLVTDLTARDIQVQLLSFSTDVSVLTGATTDTAALIAQIESLEADGNTALYDAVATGIAELIDVDAQRTLVVFSDGADTASERDLEEAISAGADAEIPVTVVVLESPDFDIEPLEEIAAGTGGRAITAANVSELEAAFEEVASDLASQYVLRYSSDLSDPELLELTVAVAAGTASQQLTYNVPNLREGAPPPPAPPSLVTPTEPSVFSRPEALTAGLVAAFLALLFLLALMFTGSRTPADKVLVKQLERYMEGGNRHVNRSGLVAAHFRDRAMELIESSPMPKGFDEKLTVRLEQAAWPLRNGEFMLLVFLAAFAPALLASIVFNPVGGILLGILTGLTPVVILENRRRKRQDRFLRALPDTLQLMAGSLRAGYGVLQAIDTVSKESSGPTAEEFNRVLTEARLGMPVEDALETMADRIGSDDLRWVVLAINIQREVGGNLAELLDTVSEVLREREMLRRQIKVLSAEGRLSAIILVLLPIFLAVYLILVRPEYVGVLVQSGIIGYGLIGGAVVLMLGGVVWIRNLVRIEV